MIPNRSIPPVPRKRGCLFWGLIILALAFLVGAVIVGVILYQVKKVVDKTTATAPATLPVLSPTSQESQISRSQADALVRAVGQNTPGTFTFSARDLNTLMATHPDLSHLRGKAFFSIEGDQLVTEASIPLDQIPGMQGRYLNGKFKLDIQFRNGNLALYAKDFMVNGQPLPESFRAQVESFNLARDLDQHPEAATALQKLESLEIRNGQLLIRTKGKP